MGPPSHLLATRCASPLDRADEALYTQGSLSSSREWYDMAYRSAQATGDHETLARAALGMGGLWVHERRQASDAAGVEARQRVALASLDERSSLGLRLAVRLAAEADYRTGAAAGVLSALEEARAVGDPVAVAEGLSLAHHCLLGPDHARDRGALADELLRVASLTGRPIDTLMGLLWSTVDHYLVGDPMADRSLAELRAHLAARDHEAVGYVLRAVEVMLALRAGRLDAAEVLAATCARAGEIAGDADAPNWYAGQLMVIRWYQGRSAELVPHLSALSAAVGTGAVDLASFAALAVGYAAAGDTTRAACALARVSGRSFEGMVRGSSWLVAIYGCVEAAHALQDAETAAAAYAVLLPFADLPIMLSLGVACLGSTQHALGVAALTTGDLRAAVDHLRRAVRANQALGHLPATTLSRHRLGQALLKRGGVDDAIAADAALRGAAVEAAALGMVLPPNDTPGRVQADPPGSAVEVERQPGPHWLVRIGTRHVVVPDGTGMRYLAVLAQRPGQQVTALELVRATLGPTAVSKRRPAHEVSRQPVIDERALRDYRARLADLTAHLEDLEATGDADRAELLRTERNWIVAELSSATGLSGRSRTFTDDAERARIAVTKAIRRSVDRLRRADAVIGAELSSRVQTGGHCCLHRAWNTAERPVSRIPQ